MTKNLLLAAIAAALVPKTDFVPRGIVAVRADVSIPEVKALIENLQKAFAEFKSANDRELAELKAGGSAADTKAKVEKIDADLVNLQAAVDEINVKAAAAQMGAGGGRKLRDAEYSEAFQAHVQRGDIQAALNKGKDDEGGYLTPVEWDRTITSKLVLVSPMRQICKVQPTSKAGFSKLFNLGGTASGWVGETDQRPETATGKFSPLTFASGEIYANPAATQQMLDDAEINLEEWLAGEVQTEFAKQESRAFLAGNGDKKPNGLLTYIAGNANEKKHPFGAIEVVNSGAAATITSDGIIDIIYDLPSAYTGGARWIMNRNTQRVVRKLKDGQGNYLWQPSFVAGQPAKLADYPITEMPDMPDVVANATPLMFGDFSQGYMIIDRIGVRVLRDPYTNKPYVSFYTTKRVGGGLLNPEPLRAMKIAAPAGV
ncbi:phage major capsid protein [Burkholderia thailandensis]|uniref:phage major capsid protein n=1 Tax=Burkholderia thailandensis TaxID=57975 RepID=UPI00107E71EE|nr:phage major capsid protein [Burkholderia thailandensis]MCZ2897307.1 phage major capsid protein [Burkholderia thailandensis]TGB34835.1 phage major capsid protein [Burkholderia thailandensis]